MKTTTILFAIFSVINFNLLAQNHSSVSYHQEEEHISSENNSEHPCISTEQYTFLENESRQNRQYLHISEPIESTTKALTVLEYWIVKASADLNDCSFYRVSAYVDQDQNAEAQMIGIAELKHMMVIAEQTYQLGLSIFTKWITIL